jgi:hypothetical protein
MDTVLFGARGQERIQTSTGLELGGLVAPAEDIDLLLLPGILHNSPHDLARRVEAMGPEIELIRACHLRGVESPAPAAAATCSPKRPARRRRATCSWWLAAASASATRGAAGGRRDGDRGRRLLTAGGACSVQSLLMR